jgi:hypothetical protein
VKSARTAASRDGAPVSRNASLMGTQSYHFGRRSQLFIPNSQDPPQNCSYAKTCPVAPAQYVDWRLNGYARPEFTVPSHAA